jgi:hypothetical protein
MGRMGDELLLASRRRLGAGIEDLQQACLHAVYLGFAIQPCVYDG